MGILSKPIRYSLLAALLFVITVVTSSPASAMGESAASYLFTLSDFTGEIPFSWVRVVPDPERNEVYVCDGGSVYVFNATGMEIYRFGDDERLGYPYDLAVLANGDLLLLSHFVGGSWALVRCDYRGEFLERRPLAGFPEGWGAFIPTRMVLRGEKLYVVDLPRMKVAVLVPGGDLVETINLAAPLKMTERQVADSGLGGFDADKDGTLYFTLPVNFKAYRLSADGSVESFGRPGGIPGRFGIVAGIAVDRSGTIYLVDTLKCVVSVFDCDFNFLYEFGQRTSLPGGLSFPKEASVSGEGKIYVTQQTRRGVNVYRVGFK